MNRVLKRICYGALAMCVSVSTLLPGITVSALMEPENTDSRIAPDKQLTLTSDNEMLNEAFKESLKFIYGSLVVGPKQFPTFETESRVTDYRNKWKIDAIPSLWGTYHGVPGVSGYRECFCLRDIEHQAEGAAFLSLNEEMYTMLEVFAKDALKDTRADWNNPDFDPRNVEETSRKKNFWEEYWTLWSYNFYGIGYYMDAGFQELPAPFELLEKAYEMYKYTGDERWISDTFLDYGRQLHNEFTERYDFNGNGIADNRGNAGILPTLYEFEGTGKVEDKYITFDNTTYSDKGILTISKEYFEELKSQDLVLLPRIKDGGGEDQVFVRINNMTNEDGTKPLLDKDYVRVQNVYNVNNDITVNINGEDALLKVKDGEKELVEGTDYIVNGKAITIKKEYIKNIAETMDRRIKSQFNFFFEGDKKASVVVELNDYIPSTQIVNTRQIELDWNDMKDLVLEIKFTDSDKKNFYKVENNMTRIAEAGDTLGVQYQSLLAMEQMLIARGLNDEAAIYAQKSADLLNTFRTEWYDEELGYARAVDALGNKYYDWGHENSFFMPMKGLLEPGEKADQYLDFIHYNSFIDPLNEEAITYLPESFYNYGKNAQGWHWLKYGLRRFYNQSEEKILSTYPEIAFLNVFNTLGLMMGIDPMASSNRVDTLSRLTSEVGYVEVNNIPVGQGIMNISDYVRDIDSLVTVKHEGVHTTTFTNQSDSKNTITWRAKFEGAHEFIYVDSNKLAAKTEVINGVTVSYVDVQVAPGNTTEASTREQKDTINNEYGYLYLSDVNYDYANSDSKFPVTLDKSYKGNSILLNQKSYQKGIGTRANTTIRYNLDGKATKFTAEVGLDDVKDINRENGSVEFKVYVDNELKFESGVMTKDTERKAVEVDLTGAKTLDLVTTNAGSNNDNDSATWADAKVYTTENTLEPQEDTRTMYLGDITADSVKGTVGFNKDNNKNAIQIGDVFFKKGLSVYGDTEISYVISGIYSEFKAIIGVKSDNNTNTNNSVTFNVYGDDNTTPLYTKTVSEKDGLVAVNLNIKDINKITLRTSGYNYGAFADARIVLDESVDLTDPAIVAKKIVDIKQPVLGDIKITYPVVPEGYTIEINNSSNEAIIDKEGNLYPAEEETTAVVSFKVKENGTDRVGVTKDFTVRVPAKGKVSLTDIKWEIGRTDFGDVKINESYSGESILIDGITYEKGLGGHADMTLVYNLENGAYKRFTGVVGTTDGGSHALTRCYIYGVDENGNETLLHETNNLVSELNGEWSTCNECLAASAGKEYVKSENLDIELVGYSKVKIFISKLGNPNSDHVAIGNPYFYNESTSPEYNFVGHEEVNVETFVNVQPKMPSKINGYFSNGVNTVTKALEVEWDTIDNNSLSTPGQIIVNGVVKGTENKAVATVTIKEAVGDIGKTLLTDLEWNPSSFAMQDIEKTMVTLNGVEYKNSIFAHADAELIYDLDGKYNRFTSVLGIKTDSVNGSVIFKIYGIDNEGKETLLTETNERTKFYEEGNSESNAPADCVDEFGYQYVTYTTPAFVDVDVTGYDKLKIVIDTAGTPNTDHSALGNPMLYDDGYNVKFNTVNVEILPEGGTVTPNGKVAVDTGKDKEFTINPHKGYVIDKVLVDGKLVEVQDGKIKLDKIDVDKDVKVSFKKESEDVVEADKILLRKVYENLKDTENNNYTEESWNVFVQALNNAKSVIDNIYATQDEVNDAARNLLQASSELEYDVVKELLIDTIEKAKEKFNSSENGTPESLKVLSDTIAKAELVLNNSEATQVEINNMITELLEAMINVIDKADNSKLVEFVGIVEVLLGYEDKYTTSSWEVLIEALNNAKEVINNGDVAEADIESAYNNLSNALANLVFKANKTSLETLLNVAKDILVNIDKYKPITVEGLQDIVNLAQEIMDNSDATQEEVDNITNNLLNSVVRVSVKANKEKLINTSKMVKEIDLTLYTDESSVAVKVLLSQLDEIINDENIDQEKVDEFNNNMEVAIKDLQLKKDNNGKDEEENNGNNGSDNGSVGENNGEDNEGNGENNGVNSNVSNRGNNSGNYVSNNDGSNVNKLTNGLPQTGNNNVIFIVAFGTILLIAGAWMCYKKKVH